MNILTAEIITKTRRQYNARKTISSLLDVSVEEL
jgi:glutamate 5-kinase